MKKVTINVPDDKYLFFLELIESLGFDQEGTEIPEAHNSLVRERIKNSEEDKLLTWKEGRKQLKLK
ncbi:hypothetical protein KI659_06105 [Litoribacter alkaliphilus]|uniref:Uncharacterized protein n=1 Tax=Litoribacter ruber TaxID=702568 RepID=A0AAP2CKQ0_9BACT|nr:hypothetical protein [Litoribacter alkaliphilus]MBS9523587.1 hypothetical protein [Litoribacter alkaliphilus]